MNRGLLAGAVAALVSTSVFAQAKEVTIGYQDMVVPYRMAQEAKALEAATGYKINWKQFGGGGEVIKAMASGAVQVGEVGSAGIAAAVSRGEPLEHAALDQHLLAAALEKVDFVGTELADPFGQDCQGLARWQQAIEPFERAVGGRKGR